MTGESVAIVVVLMVMVVMALRAKKEPLVKMTAPFFCIPLAFLAGEALRYSFYRNSGAALLTYRVVTIVIGAALGITSSLIIANTTVRGMKSLRTGYTVFALLFTAALALAYVLRITRLLV